MTPTRRLYEVARDYDYVIEVPPNRGARVSGIQLWARGNIGEPWCCDFATFCIDIQTKGNPPIGFERQGSCDAIYKMAKRRGLIVTDDMQTPLDCLFVYVYTETDVAHHIGIVTPTGGIAGNTTKDGMSSEGDRVAEHAIGPPDGSHVVYIAVR